MTPYFILDSLALAAHLHLVEVRSWKQPAESKVLQRPRGSPVDIADYAAQSLVENLLNVPKAVDFMDLGRQHVTKAFKQASDVKIHLEWIREPGTVPKPLLLYVG